MASPDAPSRLDEAVKKLRNRIRKHGKRKLGEANTKATLIEPMLQALRWDTSDLDEVEREWKRKAADKPVDYALKIAGEARVLVEAKPLQESLDDDKWLNQTISYAAVAGVQWCVLTNGDEYRIYNAHARLPAEEELLRAVRVSDEENGEATLETLQLLSKEAVAEDRLSAVWERKFADRRVAKALTDMVEAKDQSLVRLIRIRAQPEMKAAQVRESLGRTTLALSFAETTPPDVPSLPGVDHIEVPLLQAMHRRGGVVAGRAAREEIYAELGTLLGVSRDQRDSHRWKATVVGCRIRLAAQGNLAADQHGVWRLTEQGRRRAEKGDA